MCQRKQIFCFEPSVFSEIGKLETKLKLAGTSFKLNQLTVVRVEWEHTHTNTQRKHGYPLAHAPRVNYHKQKINSKQIRLAASSSILAP